MTRPERLWVVVPAHGGSARVVGNILRILTGRPPLAHILRLAVEAGLGDRTIVSGDDRDALALAAEFGVRGLERPPQSAMAEASTESVFLHVLDALASEASRSRG